MQTLERIKSEIKSIYRPQVKTSAVIEEKLSEPIQIEELSVLLENNIKEDNFDEKIKESENLEIKFNNIYEFVEWYSLNTNKFNEEQNRALGTLLTTRQMIDSGCACKRKSREQVAINYWNEFWEKNKNTDLPKFICEAAGANKISIGDFINYTK